VRAVLLTGFAALRCAVPAVASRSDRPASWLAQARCIHLKDGAWTANTGNGHFGGFQFAAKAWLRIGAFSGQRSGLSASSSSPLLTNRHGEHMLIRLGASPSAGPGTHSRIRR
jgi:hypothetical protein